MPPGELAGEVLLFRLTLIPASTSSAGVAAATNRSPAINAVISSQLYTFAVLQPGSSVRTPLHKSLHQ